MNWSLSFHRQSEIIAWLGNPKARARLKGRNKPQMQQN
jgi:hypothetical protein